MIWCRETFAVVTHTDGQKWLCLKYETTHFSLPVVVAHYWPFKPVDNRELRGGYLDGIVGAPAIKHDMSNYSFRRQGEYHSIAFRLIDGPQTKPILTTETPLPPPKVRKGIPVRFYNGWWQKYTKANGWQNIPVPSL